MGMSYVSKLMDSKTYYTAHIMDMHRFDGFNVIVLCEMRVINANLEYGLQFYLHSDFVLYVHD